MATTTQAGTEKSKKRLATDMVSDERLHWLVDPPTRPPQADQDQLIETKDPVVPSESRFPAQTPPSKPRLRRSPTIWALDQVTREIGFGTPFLLIPVLLGAGALFYWWLPREPALHNVPSLLAILVAALALNQFVTKNRLTKAVLMAALVVGLGALTAQIRTHVLNTKMLGSEITTTLTGRLVNVELRADGSARYTLDVLETERPKLRHVPRRLRVTSRTPVANAVPGDGLTGRVRLRPPSGPTRPTSYDFAFFNYFSSIGANGFSMGALHKIDVPPAEMLRSQATILINRLRLRLSTNIRGSLPSAEGGVAAALIIGDKSAIPKSVSETLRLSGLAHILSISGLHMALVAGTVMAAIRSLLALAPDWAARRPVKKFAAGAALVFVLVYLFIAGAGVATQRSFIMLGIMLGAVLMDRAAITMRNLAIAALIVIALSPETVAGPSFQMSFAATAALIATYRFWTSVEQARQRKRPDVPNSLGMRVAVTLGRYVAALLITSLVAGLATGIYAIFHFHRIAPFGLLANLLAVPIVSLATMPLAILGMLSLPTGLSGFFFQAMAITISWVIHIAEWVVSLSPNATIGAMPLSVVVCATLALLSLCLSHSWIRVTSIGLLFLAAFLWRGQPLPVVVISEDARQLAVLAEAESSQQNAAGNQVLLVNRSRPSQFIVSQWQSAYRAPLLVKPNNPNGLICDKRQCTVAQKGGGGRFYNLHYLFVPPDDPTGSSGETLCASDLLILAYSPANIDCPTSTVVITAQDLALKGAVELFENQPFEPEALSTPTQKPFRVVHALEGPTRPWNEHRQYSRAARNLAPWKPATRTADDQ